jgi:hypothetical protein
LLATTHNRYHGLDNSGCAGRGQPQALGLGRRSPQCSKASQSENQDAVIHIA